MKLRPFDFFLKNLYFHLTFDFGTFKNKTDLICKDIK